MIIIIIIILSVVCRSVNQSDTLLTRNIAHADYTWNINAWNSAVLVLFLSSNPEFYLQCFRLQVFFKFFIYIII